MKTIWKFPLAIADAQDIRAPTGAEVIAVQMQDGHPCAWAIVDLDASGLAGFTIHMRGTGHALGSVGAYVSTFQMEDGALVFHAFVSYPETRERA